MSQLIKTFFVEVVAGLLVAAIATFFIPWYLEHRRRRISNAYLFFERNQTTFQLNRGADGNFEGTIHLSIKNSSPYCLRDVFINIFVPDVLNINLQGDSTDGEVTTNRIPAGTVISCYMMKPIHPQRNHRFPREIKIKANPVDFGTNNESIIYYYFSTELGVFPRTAEFTNDESREARLSDFKNFAKLIIKIPN